MKKLFLLVSCLFLLVSCGNEEVITNEENNNSGEVVESELKNPVIEWCQLYNPNGYDTVTCVISNPNSVDIDVSYDLVFYKDGIEVARTEEKWYNGQISPNHSDIIWGNTDIPSSSDADEVKMENISVNKAYTSSIDGEVKYIETIGEAAYFSVKSDEKPTLNTIFILEYNDDNGNKKCDKGELVVVNIQSVMEQETKISIDTDLYNASSYETYYNAY